MSNMTITNTSSNTLTALPFTASSLQETGIYYLKRVNAGAWQYKIQFGTSPSTDGSWIRRYGKESKPMTGGRLLFVDTTEEAINGTFQTNQDIVMNQTLTLSLPQQDSGQQTIPNCECLHFDFIRENTGKGRIFKDSGGGYLRATVMMEFVQRSE
jgi:hypothetical protein